MSRTSFIRSGRWAVLAACLAGLPAAAQTSPDLASRIELRAFSSLTLTDAQFLQGDSKATPVTIAGELRFPATAAPGAKLPAVIVVHGSGGVGAGQENWGRIFNRMGIASFTIDSFSGRGLTQVSTNQGAMGRFNMTLDTFRALELLAAHPRIDPARIAVIGFSRGGTAVLYTAMRRFQKLWSPNFKVVETFPLYASCFDSVDEDMDVVGPIREFHCGADDYASIQQCRAYFQRLKAAGRDVEQVEFPGVHHSYDNVLARTEPTVSTGSQSQRNCSVREEKGVLVNQQTKQEFSYKDACISLDPKLGHDPDATAKTVAAVTVELRGAFALP
jgi:dienelactone hydrolase